MFTRFDNEEDVFICNNRKLRETWGNPRFPGDCYESAMRATEALITKKIQTFEELFESLAKERQRYTPDIPIDFRNVENACESHTVIDTKGRYSDQYPILKKMFFSALSHPQCKKGILYNSQYVTFQYENKYITNLMYCSEEMNGILKIQYKVDGAALGTASPNKPILIHHAPKSTYRELLPEIESIFNELKEKANSEAANENDIFYLLGKLHWLLAHSTPLTRGSATTIDLAMRAIYKMVFPEKKLVPYKEGITPDLAALFSPDIEEFARGYRHIFVDSPDITAMLQDPAIGLAECFLMFRLSDYSDNLLALRKLAFDKFTREAIQMRTHKERLEFFEEHARHPIFSEHRNKHTGIYRFLTGGFGRTSTVAKMKAHVDMLSGSDHLYSKTSPCIFGGHF